MNPGRPSIPPKMVPMVLRAPCANACETHNKADGPGEAISAAAKETYNNHKLNNIYKNPKKISLPSKPKRPPWR